MPTKWVSDYSDMYTVFALPRVNDAEIAKDLVQETFLAAWRNYDILKGRYQRRTGCLHTRIDHRPFPPRPLVRFTDHLLMVADEKNPLMKQILD